VCVCDWGACVGVRCACGVCVVCLYVRGVCECVVLCVCVWRV